MDRSKTSVVLVVCAVVLVAVSLNVAGARQKSAGVSFEAIPTGDYRVDAAHSVIGFSIRHFEISLVRGRFKEFTSTIHFDADDVTKSTVQFNAKVESVDTGVAGRDNHLRTADFFDVAQFPEMTFKSTKVEKKGKSYVMYGDFTMKGVTKQISFPYGINWGAKMANGGLNVADEVTIDLQLEAVKAAPAATQ
jgi:polyisoprenoid-binding protein YceI